MNLKAILFSLAVVFCGIIQAQDSLSIQSQYRDFYNSASTWEIYKMPKVEDLDRFWGVVSDTLAQKNQEIVASRAQVSGLNREIEQLNAKTKDLESKLGESQTSIDSISFLGTELSKGTYHAIVWGIIILLLVLVGVVYGMFARGKAVTDESVRNLKDVEAELATVKEKAHQTQIKLKRELQTALNSLNERK